MTALFDIGYHIFNVQKLFTVSAFIYRAVSWRFLFKHQGCSGDWTELYELCVYKVPPWVLYNVWFRNIFQTVNVSHSRAYQIFLNTTPGHYVENPYVVTLIFWIVPLGLCSEISGSQQSEQEDSLVSLWRDYFLIVFRNDADGIWFILVNKSKPWTQSLPLFPHSHPMPVTYIYIEFALTSAQYHYHIAMLFGAYAYSKKTRFDKQ